MNEASKTNRVRGPEFAARYLQGKVLDIGAGADLVCPNAQAFDQQHGDANEIDRYFPPASFDCVHSSHCLEHMWDPVHALARWWSLVRPGGYMIVVVPDEDLYEQGIWPSFFNSDHKTTFRLGGADRGFSPSHDVLALCHGLPQAVVISATRQDDGYDHSLKFPAGMHPKRLRHPLKFLWRWVSRLTPMGSSLRRRFQKYLVKKGYPVDQTFELALAQIEVVLQKAPVPAAR